jgi:hypothetical protein
MSLANGKFRVPSDFFNIQNFLQLLKFIPKQGLQ